MRQFAATRSNLNRLKGLKSGVLTAGVVTTVVQQEDWQTSGALKLDQTGNWVDYKRQRETVAQDTWTANVTSKINAYTTINDGRVGGVQVEVDSNGLPTKDDKTSGTTKGYHYTFDSWNRLVTVKGTGGALVEEFRYNALGHRIGWHYDSWGSANKPDGVVDGTDPWYYFQYNERWQQVGLWKAGDTDLTEVFVYGQAGMDGYGTSSYIDDVLIRERDTNANTLLDERNYYLQNWRHDVVAIINYDGQIREKMTYDAYGRPHCFSPGDLKGGGGSTNDRPDGVLGSGDTWTTGSVAWNKDIGNSSGLPIPDGVVDSNDGTTLTNLKAAGYSGGYGIISGKGIGNRKGYAGYEFDPILQGSATADNKPVYHVRNRVLACDTGKWFQKDPLGYHDSMDLYEYCASDPEDKSDAMGLTASTSCSNSTCANNSNVAVVAIPPRRSPPVPQPTYTEKDYLRAEATCHSVCGIECSQYWNYPAHEQACNKGCYEGCMRMKLGTYPDFSCDSVCEQYSEYPVMYDICWRECRALLKWPTIDEPRLSPHQQRVIGCESTWYMKKAGCWERYHASIALYNITCTPAAIRDDRTWEACNRWRRRIVNTRDNCIERAQKEYNKCIHINADPPMTI